MSTAGLVGDHGGASPRSGVSVWKLSARAVSDLSLAFGISMLVGLPFLVLITLSSPFQHQDRFRFSALPPDDEALTEWARAQPGVERPAVRRDGDIVELRYRRPGGEPLRPPWTSLGYVDARSLGFGFTACPAGADCGDGSSGGEQFAVALLVLGLASGLGLLTVGVWRVRRCRRAGEPLLTFFAGAPRTVILTGAAGGGALLVTGALSDAAFRALFGPAFSSAGVWGIVREFAPWAQAATVGLGAVVAPVGEEIFFRGAVFGAFAGPGHVRLGAAISAALFAAGHAYMGGDAASLISALVGALVAGLLFAWVYYRTGSILAPMLAHGLNNAVGFGLLFAGYG